MSALLSLWFASVTLVSLIYMIRILRAVRSGLIDPFFGILLASAAVYTLLAPSVVWLLGQEQEGSGSAVQYATAQLLTVGLFIGPMWLIYRSARGGNPLRPGCFAGLRTSNGMTVALGIGVLHGVLNMVILVRGDFFFQRVGFRAAAETTVGLSSVETAITGTFRDSVGLWIAMSMAALVLPRTTLRPSAMKVLALLLAALALLPSLANSRLDALILCATAAAMLVLTRPVRRVGRNPARERKWIAAIVLGGFLVIQLVMNARQYFLDDRTQSTEQTAIQIYQPLGDDQGLARVDCIDLMTRVEPDLSDLPGLEPFESTTWQVRRYIDRAGFDAFRLSGTTNPKSYFVQRYVSADQVDYYSCALVEGYGAFWIVGLLISGLLLGFLFRRFATQLGVRVGGQIGPAWYTSLALMIWMTKFEKGISWMLLGWLNIVPVVVLLVLLRPLRPSGRADALLSREESASSDVGRPPGPAKTRSKADPSALAGRHR